jgi:glycosyltransferase involved in cell wall biosynthesis
LGGRPTEVSPRKVLIVTDDVLTTTMAGPAIRAWQIAEALAEDHDVCLATTSPTCERESDRFRTEACDQSRFAELEQWCDVLIFQGFVLNHAPVLRHTSKVMVVDLYDPIHLEALELTRSQAPPERAVNSASPVRVLSEQMTRGDFFVCASEKQRDLWLGFLSALGRINPPTYDDDPSLRRLIDVVAFGLPDDPPVHDRASLKGVVPGIGPSDEVVLWGGGVYDWFDPVTAIRAIDGLRRRRPNVRLYFLGVRHPNPAIEESRTLTAARALAGDLGILGTHVFFNEGWVAYADRHNFLLEADVAISLHVEHVETAYSFRTRVLDYIWAGLPIVATRGDTFAEIIDREGLGRVVAGEDVGAVESALWDLLEGPEARRACRERSAGVAARFKWSDVLRPLVDFCADPRRAPDWPTFPNPASVLPEPSSAPVAPNGAGSPLSRQLRSAAAHYRQGGVGAVARAAAAKARGLVRG